MPHCLNDRAVHGRIIKKGENNSMSKIAKESAYAAEDKKSDPDRTRRPWVFSSLPLKVRRGLLRHGHWKQESRFSVQMTWNRSTCLFSGMWIGCLDAHCPGPCPCERNHPMFLLLQLPCQCGEHPMSRERRFLIALYLDA